MTGDVQDLVDGLSARLGWPVGVDDRRFGAIAYSSHESEIDPVRRASILGRRAPPGVIEWLETLNLGGSGEVVAVPANPGLGMVPRICLPLRFRSRLLGFLWLVDEDGSGLVEGIGAASEAAEAIAAALYLAERREGEEGRRQAEAVLALTGRQTAGEATGELATAPAYGAIAVVSAGDSTAARVEARLVSALETVRRAAAPERVLWHASGRSATLVAAVADQDELDRLAGALGEELGEELADAGAAALVGIGPVSPAQDGLAASYRQASVALRVATSVPDAGSPLRWDSRPDLALLVQLLGERELAPLLPAPLRRLLGDPNAETLVPTLLAYLDRAGDAPAAAADLFLHRSSLYNRLHRIEEVAGVDLHSGADRVTLHVGLLLWRLGGGATAVE